MPGDPVTPKTTLALVLGAAAFPHTKLSGPPSLAESARQFVAYLRSQEEFGLPEANLFNRFDSSDSPAQLLHEIREFLEARLAVEAPKPRDLIIYYVGHGGFANSNRDYFLALRGTERGAEGPSSLRIHDFAHLLHRVAPHLRRHVLLDACYSGEAYDALSRAQGGTPEELGVKKIFAALPGHGTALLCSSSADDVSLAPTGSECTMFSGALLHALTVGADVPEASLSLYLVRKLAEDWIVKTFPGTAVRPEVHSPIQGDGDVAHVPMFPNAALRRSIPVRLRELEQRVESLAQGLTERGAGLDELATKLRAEAVAGLSLAHKQVDEMRAAELTHKLSERDANLRAEWEAQLLGLRESSNQRDAGQRPLGPAARRVHAGGFSDQEWLELPSTLRLAVKSVSRAKINGMLFACAVAVMMVLGATMGFIAANEQLHGSMTAAFFLPLQVLAATNLIFFLASVFTLVRSRDMGSSSPRIDDDDSPRRRLIDRALEYVEGTRVHPFLGHARIASPYLELGFVFSVIALLISAMTARVWLFGAYK